MAYSAHGNQNNKRKRSTYSTQNSVINFKTIPSTQTLHQNRIMFKETGGKNVLTKAVLSFSLIVNVVHIDLFLFMCDLHGVRMTEFLTEVG